MYTRLTCWHQAQTRLDAAKTELKDVLFLKQVAVSITRLTRDSNTLTQDIAKLEQALQATGSTKTADDIQEALDALANEA
jgi:DNA repair protein RAD50